MIFNKGTYDVLKAIAQIYLPALGTLYFTLASIWNLPAPEQVVGTIVSIDTFLGVMLGISTTQYNKSEAKYGGTIQVTVSPEGTKVYTLEVSGDVDEMDKQSEITFKVNTT